MRILIVEDDPLLGDGLAAGLRTLGFAVDWFTDGAQADAALAVAPYDAVVLDLGLPGRDGLHWLGRWRRRAEQLPVLILTARDGVDQRIAGLDSGADDYLVKPFAPEELAARVRAIGRRQTAHAGHFRVFDGVQIDLSTRAVSVLGQAVELTAKEWALLEALTLRAGRLVAKADLEALLNGFDGESMSNTLEVHISHLRRKLGKSLIETVRGMGYRIA